MGFICAQPLYVYQLLNYICTALARQDYMKEVCANILWKQRGECGYLCGKKQKAVRQAEWNLEHPMMGYMMPVLTHRADDRRRQ